MGRIGYEGWEICGKFNIFFLFYDVGVYWVFIVSGRLSVSAEYSRIFRRYRRVQIIVTDWRVLSCPGGFNVDIMWPVP